MLIISAIIAYFYTLLLQCWYLTLAAINIFFKTATVWRGTVIYCGDHIRVRRKLGYFHHGLYLGNGKVIHFHAREFIKTAAIICVTTLEEFAGENGVVEIVPHRNDECFSPYMTVKRAIGYLHSNWGGYAFFTNNCQHFANWCKTGVRKSEQVQEVAVFLLDGITGLMAGLAVRSVAPRLGTRLGPWGVVAITVAVPVVNYLYRQHKKDKEK